MSIFYPPVAFYFTASVAGFSNSSDLAFQEISGVTVEMGTEEVAEGGENRFKHKLPQPIKYQNLVLKRGAVPKGSQIIDWCKQTLESDFAKPIQPKDITVSLLDSAGNALMTWNFKNAYPVKYSVNNFNSQENNIAVETIEFTYQYFSRSDG